MADITGFTGLPQLRAALEQFSARLAKNVLRAGLRQGALLVRDQARANFNTGSGPNDLTTALKKSIRVTPRRGTPTRIVISVVAGELTAAQKKKFGQDSAFYALMVEKGHINRKAGQALRGSKASVKAARAASTSNTPARPFMRPAIDAKAQAAIDALASTVHERLAEAVK